MKLTYDREWCKIQCFYHEDLFYAYDIIQKTKMTKNPALDDPEVQLIFSYMTWQIARLYQQRNMLMKKIMETRND
jgi:hypothetical protein